MVKVRVDNNSLIQNKNVHNHLCTQKLGVMMENEPKTQRDGRKRLSIDIPLFINERLEHHAKKRNMTITKFVLQAIMEKLNTERFYE